MRFEKSEKMDKDLMRENMMGPNCVKLLEELTGRFALRPGMRVLDLGCGTGLTSMFLAQAFGVTVYATRPLDRGDGQLCAVSGGGAGWPGRALSTRTRTTCRTRTNISTRRSASTRTIISGGTRRLWTKNWPRWCGRGGVIAIAMAGSKDDWNGTVPKAMAPYISLEDAETLKSPGWWEALLRGSNRFALDTIYEFEAYDEVWDDWLQCDNPLCRARPGHDARRGRYAQPHLHRRPPRVTGQGGGNMRVLLGTLYWERVPPFQTRWGRCPPDPCWRLCLQTSASFLEEKKQKMCAMPLRDIAGSYRSCLWHSEQKRGIFTTKDSSSLPSSE